MRLARSQSSRTAVAPVRQQRRGQLPRLLPKPAPVDLDELSAHWRVALNDAHDALRAAALYLPALELRERDNTLVRERESTARLLDAVAAEEHFHLAHHLGAPRPTHRTLGLPAHVLACVFDLEGVLTATAIAHAAAWAETFDPFLLERSELTGERYGPFAPFNPRTDYSEHIHGKPRLDGVRGFLAARGIRLPEGDPDDPPGARTVHGLANAKQEALLRRLEAQGVATFAGSRRYLEAVRDAGLRCAVVSASANTNTVLEHAGLARLIDERVDGDTIVTGRLRTWPEPDVLLAACRQLGIRPHQAAAYETERAGVIAGRDAGFALVVGVDRVGQPALLRESGADVVVADLSELLDPALAA